MNSEGTDTSGLLPVNPSHMPSGGNNEQKTFSEAEWTLRLEQLRLTNEELQRRKVDAEKDRDLFRDLYSRASAHASDVTRENNELSERVSIAEGQVRDGLAMIRGTYAERVRRLEEEVEKWKGLCHILTTKDQRTDDEVRRKAALEAELRQEVLLLHQKVAELDRWKRAEEEVSTTGGAILPVDTSEVSVKI